MTRRKSPREREEEREGKPITFARRGADPGTRVRNVKCEKVTSRGDRSRGESGTWSWFVVNASFACEDIR